MKKTYIQPQLVVTKIAMHNMIAESWVKSSTDGLNSNEILTHEDNGWDIWSDD